MEKKKTGKQRGKYNTQHRNVVFYVIIIVHFSSNRNVGTREKKKKRIKNSVRNLLVTVGETQFERKRPIND